MLGAFSDTAKAIGVLAVPGGNCLVELKCMRGHGVEPVDWDELEK